MKKLLVEGGYEVVNSIEEADIIVINTCAVRYDTEVRIFKRIDQILKLGKKLIIAGCLTKIYPYKLKTMSNNLCILSPQSVDKILDAVKADKPVAFFHDVKKFKVLPEIVEGVKATIPVAEGCLDECSFCVVKVARPHLSSVPIEKVVEVVKNVLNKGAIEVELTAQDLAVYGYDLYGRY
ncbi:MAG: 2-methylthioadenine synthetase, partial [Ignisphaera sp.]